MERLTIIRTPGEPDRLLQVKREHIDPVMERKAGQYGHILHVAHPPRRPALESQRGGRACST